LVTWETPTGITQPCFSSASNGSGTVVIASGIINRAVISTNHGASFTSVTTQLQGSSVTSVGFLNSTWFVSTNTGYIYTSTDGTNWTTRVSSGDVVGGGFAYDGTTVVAGSSTSSANAARTSTFANLSSWTDRVITPINGAAGPGGTGGTPGGGGGGGGCSENGHNSGAGGTGGGGLVRVYTW